MKVVITLIMLIFAYNLGISDTVTHKFTTLGNCYVCKVRIEQAVKKLNGITTVNWDYNYDVTTVTYDESLIDLHKIMKTIAGVGHDTEWYPADSAAYAFLIGSCCEYVRDIDYSKAQIGYLSLENTWLSVNQNNNMEFNIFPTLINDGYFNIESDSQLLGNMDLKIFSLTGSEIYSKEILPGQSEPHNISGTSSGQYFLIISEKNKIIFSTRIIIQ